MLKIPALVCYFLMAAIASSAIKNLDDGTYFAEIPSCPGVWANERTEPECREIIREVFEEWLIFKLRDKDYLPPLNNIDLTKVVEEDWGQ